MKTLTPILQTGKLIVLAIAGGLSSSNLLYAKEGSTSSESSGGGSWVLSFFFVLLAIVLGMLVVCRTSTRRDRIRPEAYTEGKVGHTKE